MRDGSAGFDNKKRSRLCHRDRWRPEAGRTLLWPGSLPLAVPRGRSERRAIV